MLVAIFLEIDAYSIISMSMGSSHYLLLSYLYVLEWHNVIGMYA